jgi:D-3-phosphoglycerate dehydrogenase
VTVPLDVCVLVTPRSFGAGDPALREALERRVREVRYNDLGRPLTSAELRERLDGAAGLIAGLDEVDADVLATPGLRVVSRYGVGTDRVDLAAAERLGVTVTNTPGANAGAVAELTLTLMLVLCRPVLRADREVRGGGWPALRGRELGARTVGLLGLGRIGSRVARSLTALGATVLAHDPAIGPDEARARGAQWVPLEELLARSDVLSLHLPATDKTRGIVDDRLLARVRPGAVLVNTARGELVVEEALVRALDDGRLAGAALDALAEEPPAPGHPLLCRDDVVVTSHLGGQTAEATAAMGRQATDDLLAVLRGDTPRHPVVAPHRPLAMNIEEPHE